MVQRETATDVTHLAAIEKGVVGGLHGRAGIEAPADDDRDDGEEGEEHEFTLPWQVMQIVDDARECRGDAEPDEEDPGRQKFEHQEDTRRHEPHPVAEEGEELLHYGLSHFTVPVGGTLPRLRIGCAGGPPPKASLAISDMPAIDPMTEAASSGSMSTFWLGEMAICSSALM